MGFTTESDSAATTDAVTTTKVGFHSSDMTGIRHVTSQPGTNELDLLLSAHQP